MLHCFTNNDIHRQIFISYLFILFVIFFFSVCCRLCKLLLLLSRMYGRVMSRPAAAIRRPSRNMQINPKAHKIIKRKRTFHMVFNDNGIVCIQKEYQKRDQQQQQKKARNNKNNTE